MSAPALTEHFFRHEYGRLVATLTRRVGLTHLEAAEDAVQRALLTALEVRKTGSTPDNPSAWLFRVAHNALLDDLRKQSRRRRILDQHGLELVEDIVPDGDVPLAGDMQDDLLRMLFICCDRSIPDESQLVFALKTLCGFDTHEIAMRLFATEANVLKRLSRARNQLRELTSLPEVLSDAQYSERLPAVHRILYVLFTEGHLSTRDDSAIRRELCDEAIRLATVLVAHPLGQTPETYALLALMYLHRARLSARRDASGGLLLLIEQDRNGWDQSDIATGLSWLAQSAQGAKFSRYHAEAGIAAEHCLATSFSATRWDRVVACYELLERTAPSALHRLNRAIATAEWQGADAGLRVLSGFEPPGWLSGSYLWSAVLSDLYRRSGDRTSAQLHRDTALALAPSSAIRRALQKRLGLETLSRPVFDQ